MTLPTAPPISWTQICAEFALTATTAVWPRDFYGKGGAPASGNLSFADFLGRSGLTYSPNPGSYSDDEVGTATYTVYASAAVVWTWSRTAGTAGAVTDQNGAAFTSGGTANSLTFTISGTTTVARSSTFSVQSGGNTWTITVTGEATGSTCVTVSSWIMLANGLQKQAWDLQVGDWVWTRHEITGVWGAHRVSAVEFAFDDVYAIPGFPTATWRHRFGLKLLGKMRWWRAGWLGRRDGNTLVAKITVEGAHTYMARHPKSKRFRLCHNIKTQ